MNSCRSLPAGSYKDEVVEAAHSDPEPEPRKKVAPEVVVKTCPRCLRTWTWHNKCPGCKTSLPTKKDTLMAEAGSREAQEQVYQANTAQRFTKAAHRVTSVSTGADGQPTYSTKTVSEPLFHKTEGQSVKSMQLPIIAMNPNNDVAINAIMREYYQLVGLRSYTKTDQRVDHEWVIVDRDDGATQAGADSDPRVLSLLGSGHEAGPNTCPLCQLNLSSCAPVTSQLIPLIHSEMLKLC